MLSAFYFYVSNAALFTSARFSLGDLNHGLAGPILWWQHGR
jgi:hypothetical protein